VSTTCCQELNSTDNEIRKKKECLEKDCKIDWSATAKIECCVNVLLDKPTEQEDLIVACGDASCDNVYREQMHKKFNEICVKVDLTNERAELVDHERLDAVE
jgi:hypothetical protein